MLIKLPFPDAALNPNRKNGRHWGATNKIKMEAFKYAYYATREAMPNKIQKDMPLVMALNFIAPDRRKRDLDNLLANGATKASIDGICKALGVDDNAIERVILMRGYKKNEGKLLIRIFHDEP